MLLELGTEAPDFALPDTTGKTVTRDEVSEENGLLVMFICNHCPFVKHIRSELTRIGRDASSMDIGVVAISSNDVENYPDDSPVKMGAEKFEAGYTFPYLYDESQDVAKAYHAACTPDFFLFDADLRLVYRGQLDDARPGGDAPVTGADLRGALRAVAGGTAPDPAAMKPSLGCNIKWKPGNEPSYLTA